VVAVKMTTPEETDTIPCKELVERLTLYINSGAN
jgi:hypothetical protein